MTNLVSGVSIANIDQAADPVVLTVSWSTARDVGAVDLIDVSLSGAALAACVQVETSVDLTTWVALGPAFAFGGGVRSRRACVAPGESRQVRGVRVRLAAVALAALHGRSLSVAQLAFWAFSAMPSVASVVKFRQSDGARYQIVLTDRHADVFEGLTWRTGISIPHGAGQLLRTRWTQGLDTLLIFHPDVPPWRVFRQGSAAEWDFRPVVFERLPRVEFPGAVYVNGVNEVQQINFATFATSNTFNLTHGELTTSAIVWSNVGSTLAAAVQAALRALPGYADAVTVASTGTNQLSVTFGGALAQAPQPALFGAALSGDGVVFTATLTQGVRGGEDLMSTSRGWPACGVFYQQRLWLGGFRSAPNAILASDTGAPYSFNIESEAADTAILFYLDSNELNEVRELHAGRHLTAFSATSEWWLDGRVLAKGEPMAWVLASRRGVQHSLPAVELDGSLLFVQRGGQGVREFVYTESDLSYRSDSVSLLASHLIRSPVAVGVRRINVAEQSDLYLLVQNDGSLSVFASTRSQDVAGWTPWVTSGGAFRAVGDEDEPLVIVDRSIFVGNSVESERRIERLERGCFTDGAVFRSVSGLNKVTGLEIFEGATVDVLLNGAWHHRATVASAQITLPGPVTGTLEIGRPVLSEVRLMPWRPDTPQGAPLARKFRLRHVSADLGGSRHVEVQVNAGARFEVPARFSGDPPDALAGRFDWPVRMSGFSGYHHSVDLAFLQARSGRFEVLGVALEGEAA